MKSRAPSHASQRPFALCSVCFLGLLWAGALQAQSITGNIATPWGVPIEGVRVNASQFGTGRLSDVTDTNGNYTLSGGFGGLNGTYTVTPSKTGYTFNPASSNVTVRTGFGDVTVNFATPATAPSVTTQSGQSFTATNATLFASVNPQGADTVVLFEYGLTTSYGSSALKNAGGGNSAAIISVNITGLLNGTDYHFRAVASNSFGVAVGADKSFTTPSGIPAVSTLGPTEGGATKMRLNGSVIGNGASPTVWFDIGTTTSYEFPSVTQTVGTSPTTFSQLVIGLTAGTTYHYRAAASTSFGTNYGADMIFTPLFGDIAAGLPGVAYSAVAWGDYDNDGRLDILLTGTTNGLPLDARNGVIAQVWRNIGSGFSNINAGLPGVSGRNNGHGSVAWGDYDSDGRLDILLTGFAASNAISQIWRNTGSGFAQDTSLTLPAIYDGTVAWGDYDNDGRLDILFAAVPTATGNSWQVWRNTGHGFVDINAGLPADYAVHGAAAWGDYNSDGLLDIVLMGRNPGFTAIAQVWRNTGGQFVNINAGLPGYWAGAVAWGDYDNDGRLDLAFGAAVPSGHSADVWRNTGAGFPLVGTLAAPGDGSLAWGDYDGDGRLDLLVTGSGSTDYMTQIYHNNGDGTFTAINAGLPGVFRSSVAWGDYDNDGRPDILLTGLSLSGPISQVLRNNFPTTNSPPAAPSNLSVATSNSVILLSWNAASDAQTPAAGLTYNVRIGTTPGGSDVLSPMSAPDGFRRVPQLGNAQERLFTRFENRPPGTTYYWSVQAVDNAFAGSAFAPESSFKFAPTLMPIANTTPIPGDLNADGVVDQSELNTVLSNYWPNSGWLQMTNPMKLSDGYFQFALTNASSWNLSVLVSSNLVDWDLLGPAFPVYQFFDPQGTNAPDRFYRLSWP